MAGAVVTRHRAGDSTGHHDSPWPFLTALGAAFVLAGLLVPAAAILGAAILGIGVGSWIKDLGAEMARQRTTTNLGLGWTAILVFLVAEAALFGVLFFYWFWARSYSSVWPPEGFPALDLRGPAVNTAILIASGATGHLGLHALERGNRTRFTVLISVTIVLGVLFLILQVLEYSSSGFGPADGAFGGAFYALTGTHGAHVGIGLGAWAVALGLVARRAVTPARPAGVRIVTAYWHFVDAVWILLFLVVYIRVV